MTTPSTTPRVTFETIDGAIDALRSRGLRLSMSRQLVLEALFNAAGPVSADQLAAHANLDPTSVYRNLETLERHGLLRHVHLGHGPGLYTLVGQREHEYIYCPDCGTARAVRRELLDPVRIHIKRRFGYEVSFTHFPLVGRCPGCSVGERADPHVREC